MSGELDEISILSDKARKPEGFNSEVLSPEEVHILIPHDEKEAVYNAAVIGDLYILARKVPIENVRRGIPDRGVLAIFKKTERGKPAVEVGTLPLDKEGVDSWEDPRALTWDENVQDENVLMGLTAIREVDMKPVAATIRGRIKDGDFTIDPESLTVCFEDEGKNITPFSKDKFLFRRKGFPHTLEVAKTAKNSAGQDKIEVIKTIEFPKRSWCQEQIGTQAHMLPGGILPIHGTNKFSLGIDPETNQEVFGYSYSLGLAQLDKNMNVVKVTEKPLFTRRSFKDILPMGKELDPNKDVIYCCGYSVSETTVTFVINIGDLMTVEVDRKLSELQDMLAASELIIPEELEDEFPQTLAA